MESRGNFAYAAAISPYSKLTTQPKPPRSGKILAAAYLFRHGIIEVSKHDYLAFIKPFLARLTTMQATDTAFATGPLAFLQQYKTWITDAHVGAVNASGLAQCRELAAALRTRYRNVLREWEKVSKSQRVPMATKIWTDSAPRCEYSAVEFSKAFGGIGKA